MYIYIYINKIKDTLSIKFYSIPLYDEKCVKAKVRELVV